MKKYYELTERTLDKNPLQMVSAAVLDCQLCGDVISGGGGPGLGCICKECGDKLLQGTFMLHLEKSNE